MNYLKKPALGIIFSTIFIDLMGFGILIPILPSFSSKILGISDFSIGIVIAVYSLLQFLFNPIFGKISDKYGRRPVILYSLFLTSMSYIIFSFSTTFFLLLISRIIAGFGGSNIGAAQAYIADITAPHERAKGMGLIGAAFGLGFLFGPLIGGYLSTFGYEIAGFAAAGFSFIAFIFAYFFLPESLKEKKDQTKISIKLIDFNYTAKVLSRMPLGLFVTLFFIIVFSMANIYGTFALLTLKVYHLNDQQTGYMYGIIGLIGAIVQGGLIRKLSEKFSDMTLVRYGMILMIIGLSLLPYGGTITGLAIVTIILAVGTGILQPTVLSLVSKFSPENEQGSILGVNQSLASLGRVLGPLWGGFSYDFLGYQFPFLTGAFTTLITFLLITSVFKKYIKHGDAI
ncbi:MAG: MFS transporter [Ignavibacteriales bacterium]|nr:MFS transporter [Ignavibacteriales bacterium]